MAFDDNPFSVYEGGFIIERPPSRAPCLDDNRRYSRQDCRPHECQAPQFGACRDRIAKALSLPPPPKTRRCPHCGHQRDPSEFTNQFGNWVRNCESCRGQRSRYREKAKAGRLSAVLAACESTGK